MITQIITVLHVHTFRCLDGGVRDGDMNYLQSGQPNAWFECHLLSVGE